MWDTFTHEGGHVVDDATGDVACDSYHKFKDDVKLMKAVGVSIYPEKKCLLLVDSSL